MLRFSPELGADGGFLLMKALSIAYHDVTDGSNGELLGYKALYKLSRDDFHKHILSIRQHGAEVAASSINRFREWDGHVPGILTFHNGDLSALTTHAFVLKQSLYLVP